MRHVFRLRDFSGSEIRRRAVLCGKNSNPKASPNLKRVAYFVERNGGTLKPSFDDTRDASLCIETFEEKGSSKRNVFDVGVGRQLEIEWATDDVVVCAWKKRPNDYSHYDCVVINVETGKWHVLPFDIISCWGVDVSNGRVCLVLSEGDKYGIYDVRTDGIVAFFDTSDPSWPQDDGRFRLAGIENGVGIMFAGLRTWMLVDWDGKLVRSGPLRRKGIGHTGWTIGHRRLVVHLFGSDDWAVLSLDNKLLYRGCSPMPSPDGYLLICGQDGW